MSFYVGQQVRNTRDQDPHYELVGRVVYAKRKPSGVQVLEVEILQARCLKEGEEPDNFRRVGSVIRTTAKLWQTRTGGTYE